MSKNLEMTAQDIHQILADSLRKLSSGEASKSHADAIAGTSRVIFQGVQTRLKVQSAKEWASRDLIEWAK